MFLFALAKTGRLCFVPSQGVECLCVCLGHRYFTFVEKKDSFLGIDEAVYCNGGQPWLRLVFSHSTNSSSMTGPAPAKQNPSTTANQLILLNVLGLTGSVHVVVGQIRVYSPRELEHVAPLILVEDAVAGLFQKLEENRQQGPLSGQQKGQHCLCCLNV